MEEQLTGQYVALDGWRMDWDLATSPNTIWFYGPDGQVKSHISGRISSDDLAWELAEFEREHGPEQLALFEL